jgi:hypothetical protein
LRRRDALEQIEKDRLPFFEKGRSHSQRSEHFNILPVIDDLQNDPTDLVRSDSPLGELVGNDEPKRGVILIMSIVCGIGLDPNQDFEKAVTFKWQARNCGDGSTQVGCKVP